jgi:hypothetical protein
MRPLFSEERDFLQRYFGAGLELAPVRIVRTRASRCWSPFGARIHLTRTCFERGQPDRRVRLADPATASIFAHEATHVWQRQRGRAVTREGALLQTLYALRLHDPYAYDRRIEDPVRLLAEFVLGNIEQQGRIMQDYVLSDLTGRATDRFCAVARWVRLSASK